MRKYIAFLRAQFLELDSSAMNTGLQITMGLNQVGESPELMVQDRCSQTAAYVHHDHM